MNTQVGKIRRDFAEIQTLKPEIATKAAMDLSNIADLSLDQIADIFGIQQEDLNNPLVRPILEKMLDRIKAGSTANDQEQVIGY